MNDKVFVQYMVHDPVGNVEAQITDFNPEHLKAAEEAGMLFIGVKANGSRVVVSVEDVKEPKLSIMGGLPIVLPSYVDSKVDEIMEIVHQLLMAVSDSISKEKKTAIQGSILTLQTKAREVIKSEKAMLSDVEVTGPIVTSEKS